MKYGNLRFIPAQTPAIDATPDYSQYDSLFATPLEIPMQGCAGGQGVIQTVVVTDKANQKPTLTVLFFKDAPSGGTYTNNSGLVLSAADRGNFLGKIEIASTDWTSLSSEAVATAFGPLPVKGKDLGPGIAGGSALTTSFKVYVLVCVGGAYNAGSTSDLAFAFGILGD